MKICRFDDNRLGLVRGDTVHDVTTALDLLPAVRWPVPPGDLLIAHLATLKPEIEKLAQAAPGKPVASVRLLSPVANPTKIIGAPINYKDHVEESKKDQGIAYGRVLKSIGEFGLFLKANSALVGPGEGVALRFPDRRNDHEAELAVIIGRTGTKIARADALSYIAAYAIGLDMTVRGSEVPSFRKSIDTYAVLGPWLVTADDIADPDNLGFELRVNGETRQKSNTRFLDFGVARLIEFASEFYTLHPGDIIMTGTPAGVGPVAPGDTMTVTMPAIGEMQVAVRAA
jgi:2-keto-4-pentenoate hydratase/2-oxohepta-3-ene-1,7-dioic acid hydratase in catechol pathway